MFSDSSQNMVPEWFSRLCSLHLTNTRTCYTEIIDIVESDAFLRAYVKDLFRDFLKKGGHLGMLTALGAHGFRNRLAESILVHATEKRYPQEVEADYVQDVLDLEQRFDFLFYEGNSRVFLMGMFFKFLDVSDHSDQAESLVNIPILIDELLQDPKAKTETPDWIIIVMLVLFKMKGAAFLKTETEKYNGEIEKVLALLSEDEKEEFFSYLLKYAEGTNSPEFFYTSKVN